MYKMKNGYGHVWTEEKVKLEIFKAMDVLMIDRMPTSLELKTLGRNDLHLKICRTKKYSGWASYLDLERKKSETVDGQENEQYISDYLTNKGFSVQRMSTKHPYDLVINDTVKVDVKTGRPYLLRGSRVHTFGISKKEPTCDIYICLAFDEKEKIERNLIIPSHYLKIVTLCIGKESKYNKFIDRWDYIDKYSEFYSSVG